MIIEEIIQQRTAHYEEDNLQLEHACAMIVSTLYTSSCCRREKSNKVDPHGRNQTVSTTRIRKDHNGSHSNSYFLRNIKMCDVCIKIP